MNTKLKINTSFEKKLLKNWERWMNSRPLREAMDFPRNLIQNFSGAKDTLDITYKNFMREYLHPEGEMRKVVIEVFEKTTRITAFIHQWMDQIMVDVDFYMPGIKDPCFALSVSLSEHHSMRYRASKPPTLT